MLFFHLLVFIVLSAIVAQAFTPYTYKLQTLAGTGVAGPYENGGLAKDSVLTSPYSAWSDADGNIYFTDPALHVVRKITAGDVGSNSIEGFAGAGQTTYQPSEEGDDAYNAHLNRPRGVWGDNKGNIFIADTVNFRVRIVNSAGKIFTLAGNGLQGHSDGPATTSNLNSPFAGFTDASGKTYIADLHACEIRVISSIDPSSAVLGTLIGDYRNCVSTQYNSPTTITTSLTLGKPFALWGDNAGNLYFPEVTGDRIQQIDTNAGKISTFLSGLNEPTGVWGDTNGNIFFSERGNGGAVKLVSSTKTVTSLPVDSGIIGPRGIWGDTFGNIYVPDNKKHKIYMIAHVSAGSLTPSTTGSSSGGSLVVGGGISYDQQDTFSGNGKLASTVNLAGTFWVWSDKDNNLYLTMPNRHLVIRIDVFTNVVTIVAGIPADGGYNGASTPIDATNAKLYYPGGLWGDDKGKLYIADGGNRRVRVVDLAASTISNWAGTAGSGSTYSGAPGAVDLVGPAHVWGDKDGNIYVVDTHAVFKYTKATDTLALFAGNPTQWGFHFDSDPLKITTTAGQWSSLGQLGGDSNGNIFFVDQGNSIVWKVSSAGVASVVAGDVSTLLPTLHTEQNCDTNKNSPLCTTLLYPYGLFVDNSGTVFTTSFWNGVSPRVIAISSDMSSFDVVYSPSGNPMGIYGDGQGTIFVTLNSGVEVFVADTRRRLESPMKTNLRRV